MIYVVGMFICTMLFNVPLNNALAAVEPGKRRGLGGVEQVLEGMDAVEPCADDRVNGRERALHLGNCGKIAP